MLDSAIQTKGPLHVLARGAAGGSLFKVDSHIYIYIYMYIYILIYILIIITHVVNSYSWAIYSNDLEGMFPREGGRREGRK